MKLTIVGLKDEYVQRLAADMARHRVQMSVIPRVLEPRDNEYRHTVVLTGAQFNIGVYDETPTAERMGIIIGESFNLTLWNDVFYSMYLR